MVEGVEHLGAKFKTAAFPTQREALEDGNVPVVDPSASYGVATGISELARSRLSKRCGSK
jgi:hypothetical protein